MRLLHALASALCGFALLGGCAATGSDDASEGAGAAVSERSFDFAAPIPSATSVDLSPVIFRMRAAVSLPYVTLVNGQKVEQSAEYTNHQQRAPGSGSYDDGQVVCRFSQDSNAPGLQPGDELEYSLVLSHANDADGSSWQDVSFTLYNRARPSTRSGSSLGLLCMRLTSKPTASQKAKLSMNDVQQALLGVVDIDPNPDDR